MTALARAGRPVESFRAFDAYRRVLADEVGVTPSRSFRHSTTTSCASIPTSAGSGPRRRRRWSKSLPTGTVTFLFTDLEGSTRLWEEHAEDMAGALARHNEIVRDAVETNGGFVVKTTGDGFHAAFANASDALDAAVAAQHALQAEPWPEPVPLQAWMGVHTGEANRRDGDYYGPALNHAARLMGIAHGGQIVCSGIVAHLAGGGDGLRPGGSRSAPIAGRRVGVAGVPGERAGPGVAVRAARRRWTPTGRTCPA